MECIGCRPAVKVVAILLCVAIFEALLLFLTKEDGLESSTYDYRPDPENLIYGPDVQTSNAEHPSQTVPEATISTGDLQICTTPQRLAILKEACQEIGHQVPKEFHKLRREPAVVDRNHRIVLGWVSKGGCTALKSLLLDAAGYNVTQRIHLHSLIGVHNKNILRKYNIFPLNLIEKKDLPEVLSDYTRILVVRNPFERLLSAYRGKVVSDDSRLLTFRKQILSYFENKTIAVNNKKKSLRQLPVPSFAQFAQWIAETRTENVHWNPIFVTASACSIDWDYVLRLETMQHDSQFLLDKLKKDLPYDKMPVRHSHKHGPTMDHSSMLLPEYKNVKQLVMDYFVRLYDTDMKMFGYQFDHSTTTSSCSIKQESDTGFGCC